jgi:hypothetical protein
MAMLFGSQFLGTLKEGRYGSGWGGRNPSEMERMFASKRTVERGNRLRNGTWGTVEHEEETELEVENPMSWSGRGRSWRLAVVRLGTDLN